jgi:hypothetical protein
VPLTVTVIVGAPGENAGARTVENALAGRPDQSRRAGLRAHANPGAANPLDQAAVCGRFQRSASAAM